MCVCVVSYAVRVLCRRETKTARRYSCTCRRRNVTARASLALPFSLSRTHHLETGKMEPTLQTRAEPRHDHPEATHEDYAVRLSRSREAEVGPKG